MSMGSQRVRCNLVAEQQLIHLTPFLSWTGELERAVEGQEFFPCHYGAADLVTAPKLPKASMFSLHVGLPHSQTDDFQTAYHRLPLPPSSFSVWSPESTPPSLSATSLQV